MLDLLLGQGGGGFVKNDDLRMEGNRLGDFNHLTLGNGHGAHDRLWVNGNFQLIKNCGGILKHFFLGDNGQSFDHLRITPQPDIVHHTALKRLVQFLVHHGDAVIQRLPGGFEIDFFILQIDVAFVLCIYTKQAFHQR